ncbi:hypothetical protein CAPTEDRAFT_55136, partial [Capitella teleta]|uniref:VWFA domain-containing protein n=1 Tax=Capitella teleta TaxID=283909 RepID=X2B608_CAPTE
SLDGLRAACEDIGLEDCGLTIGVDFTASNEWQGRRTFHQECLHLVSPVHPMNPYQRTILAFGSTLAPVKTSRTIAAFGFGDSKTKDHDVFPLNQQNGGNCTNIEHVLKCYKHCAASVVLSGPTSFVPIIQKAINTTRKNPQFHVLLIIADGCMSDEPATRKAISEAYKHPISIILVGVGDGPWDKMHAFNDKMSRQGFNFHFVEYDSSVRYSKSTSESFLLHAFMMIPDQYESMKRRG